MLSAARLIDSEIQTRDHVPVRICDVIFNDRTWDVVRLVVQFVDGPDRQERPIPSEALLPPETAGGPPNLDVTAEGVLRTLSLGTTSAVSEMRTTPSEMFRWEGRLGVGVPAPGWSAKRSDEQWAASKGIETGHGLLRSSREVIGYQMSVSQEDEGACVSDLLLVPAPWRVAGFVIDGQPEGKTEVAVDRICRISWADHSVLVEAF